MSRMACVFCAAACLAASLCGQGKAFEIASLKLVSPPRNGAAALTSLKDSQGRLAYLNVSPRVLICLAYSLDDRDLVGTPGWTDSTYYDLAATFPVEAARAEVLEMLRNLLTERLQLKLHSQQKTERGFALVVDYRGPKLKPARVEKPRLQIDSNRGQLAAEGQTTDVLAALLARAIGQPVQNLTNLAGNFDIELSWAPETTSLNAPPSDRPPLFVALTEQLGLKLRPQMVSVTRIVVDRLQREPREE